MTSYRYAGFWVRVVASLIDTVLLLALLVPLLLLFFGDQFWMPTSAPPLIEGISLQYILPAIVVMVFWYFKSATPGKMVLKLKIIDAKTGNTLSKKQILIRYVGYYLSTLVFLLGFIWVGIDREKRGLHDFLADTRVIHSD